MCGLCCFSVFFFFARSLARWQTDSTHRLFITTERHKFFVLRWDADTRELRTEAQGDSKVKIGRLTENSTIALVDPTNSWFGLQQYDGVLQMLAIEPNGTLDKTIYDCKFDQLQVIQLAFLHQCAKPTVLVLSNEVTAGQDRRVLKSWTYEAKVGRVGGGETSSERKWKTGEPRECGARSCLLRAC